MPKLKGKAAPCKQCGSEPSAPDGDFCSDDCSGEWALTVAEKIHGRLVEMNETLEEFIAQIDAEAKLRSKRKSGKKKPEDGDA